MNYIWSKLSLLAFLEEWINKIVWNTNYDISDLFAWTWIVWRFFKDKWHNVISNDLQYYSYVLNKNYIENNIELRFVWLKDIIPEIRNTDKNKELIVIDYLNNIPLEKWFIYNNYSAWWTKWQEHERLYFTDENAIICDTIRIKIEEWYKSNLILEQEYYFLLASLIESIDKVANTASIYGAFLKQIKKSALPKMILKSANFKIIKDWKFKVYNKDVNELVKETKHDVVYLDPPYNHRQYSWNYHLLETIAKYDNPEIFWKTWTRNNLENKSEFCSKVKVKDAFNDLISNIDANYIFVSYNDEWLLSLDDMKEIMSKRWEYWVITKEYKRYKADKTESRNHKKDMVYEYLHYVKIKK